MMRAIRKQARVFVAIIVLIVGALAIGGYILSNQRFYLPAWVPVLGTNFYEVEAELPSGQAVVPGQGQTVNIAGVKVGEVGDVALEDGHAVVTMQIQEEHAPIYRDATILLRPKTGLKDMFLSLDPGTRESGELPEGGNVRLANTLPDVNGDEILAELDADTRAYLRVLINAGGEAFSDDAAEQAELENTSGAPGSEGSGPDQPASADLRETLKRFEPLARNGARIERQLARRRGNLRRVIHNFQLISTELASKDDQLADLIDSANANFEALAAEEDDLRAALTLFPGALLETESTLNAASDLGSELGPALEGLRPFARNLAPALRETRPFLRETTPIIRDQIRPFARDVQPTVRDLKAASKNLAVVTPRLTNTFRVLNALFNELAYEPSGAGNSLLFWAAWGSHAGATMFTTQDAHGPLRRGLVIVSCQGYEVLDAVVAGNPQLGLLTQLNNFPAEAQVCPQNIQDGVAP